MNIFDFNVSKPDGKTVSMKQYQGKVLLIVNTASKCGFTPQFEALEKLYEEFKNNGFEILAFPCNQFLKQDPGTNDEIVSFCKLNFGVTFPVFAKIDVNGPDADPVFKYLTNEARGVFASKRIKWNFTKFLIDRSGKVLKRYAPIVKPEKIREDIKKLL